MNDASAAIAELRTNWARLHDLDRADAIFAVHQSGVSLRHLARELNCSESLLRHLLKAREASAEDRYFARHNLISTRELARRSRRARFSSAPRSDEAAEFDRARAALETSREICEWLVRERIEAKDKAKIIQSARDFLGGAEQRNIASLSAAGRHDIRGGHLTLPPAPANPGGHGSQLLVRAMARQLAGLLRSGRADPKRRTGTGRGEGAC